MDMVLSYPREREAAVGVVAGEMPHAGTVCHGCDACSRSMRRGARYGPLLAMFFTIFAQAEDGGGNEAVLGWQRGGVLAVAMPDPPVMPSPADPLQAANAAVPLLAAIEVKDRSHALVDMGTLPPTMVRGSDQPDTAAESSGRSGGADWSGGAAWSEWSAWSDSSPMSNPSTGVTRVAPVVNVLDRPPQIVLDDEDYDAPGSGTSAGVLRSGYGADEFRDAPGAMALAATGQTVRRQTLLLHFDDITTATGVPAASARTLALALDAVLPRSGVTIQPRVQLAYQPTNDTLPNGARVRFTGDESATGLGVRLYGAQPSRLAGVYPFVEADWWQDNRKQALNINGTRIDADVLRGLFSFNVGAHGSTRSGVKIWVKVKGGRNAGGIVGARYRW